MQVDSSKASDARALGADPQESSGRPKTARRSLPTMFLVHDLMGSLRAPGFWLYGAWMDTSLRHREQALGALWSVAGTLIIVVFLGTLYSVLLNNTSPIYYAHLASGYVLWIFMVGSLTRSSRLYTKNRGMIQNGYVKYPDYVLRMFCGEFNNLAYNLIVVFGAVVLTPVVFTTAVFALLFTVPLFLAAILGTCFLFSVIGARYPDFGELLRTVIRLGFFVTPIIWVPGAVGGKAGVIGAFLFANPFYYMIEIVRAPLVYAHVPWFEVGVVAAVTPVIWLMASLAYARARPYVPLWL